MYSLLLYIQAWKNLKKPKRRRKMKTNYLEEITDILVEQLGIDREDVKPESRIEIDLGADSLDTVEICMALEADFDVEISDEEFYEVGTVDDIVKLVESKCKRDE